MTKVNNKTPDNTIIEYTGGAVLADSPSAVAGYYAADTDANPQFVNFPIAPILLQVIHTMTHGISM